MANIIMNIEEQNLSLLFVGDEAKNKERALNNIEKWWQNKQKIYLTKLRTKTKESKQLDELKKEHILRLASIQKSLT